MSRLLDLTIVQIALFLGFWVPVMWLLMKGVDRYNRTGWARRAAERKEEMYKKRGRL